MRAASESTVGLKIIVTYKLVRAVVSILLACWLGATALTGATDRLRSLAEMLREHVVGAWSVRLADLLVRAATPRHLAIISTALAADGSFALFEGWALRRRFAWAPWLVVVATASLLPLEVYEIYLRVRIGRVLVLLVNLAIVIYLYRKETSPDRAPLSLQTKALLGLAQLTVALAFVLFLGAGTFRYWEGWVFLLAFSGYSLAITSYLLRRDPDLLERRVRAGPVAETRPRQKVIQVLASSAFISMIAVPALDRRFAWSHVSPAFVVLGEILVGIGFWIVFLVFRENTYAAATVEVGAEQRVIETGPYAWVRHPMYAGAIVLLTGIPLALASAWGLLTLGPFIVILIARLRDEESLLTKELSGYEAYRRKTRYRLIPRVW